MITEVTVLSSDAVPFTVLTWAANEAQALVAAACEIRFAVTRTAAQLDVIGDYRRKTDAPPRRTPRLKLIRGGKS